MARAASEVTPPSALVPGLRARPWVKNTAPTKAVLLGIPRLNVAAWLSGAPVINDTESVLTRPKQPGAPKPARLRGSGPRVELVLLQPKMKKEASTGRLVMRAEKVVPIL